MPPAAVASSSVLVSSAFGLRAEAGASCACMGPAPTSRNWSTSRLRRDPFSARRGADELEPPGSVGASRVGSHSVCACGRLCQCCCPCHNFRVVVAAEGAREMLQGCWVRGSPVGRHSRRVCMRLLLAPILRPQVCETVDQLLAVALARSVVRHGLLGSQRQHLEQHTHQHRRPAVSQDKPARKRPTVHAFTYRASGAHCSIVNTRLKATVGQAVSLPLLLDLRPRCLQHPSGCLAYEFLVRSVFVSASFAEVGIERGVGPVVTQRMANEQRQSVREPRPLTSTGTYPRTALNLDADAGPSASGVSERTSLALPLSRPSGLTGDTGVCTAAASAGGCVPDTSMPRCNKRAWGENGVAA